MKPQLTLEAFADWCEKQPADLAYDYMDLENCAVAQYARSLGTKSPFITHSRFWSNSESLAALSPRTFGALAARLRAAS
jgi:hypothetical protein